MYKQYIYNKRSAVGDICPQNRALIFTLIVTVTLTFDLVTSIYIKGSSTVQGQCTCEVSSQSVHSLTSNWSETIFTLIVTVTLTFDLVTPISIGVIYCARPMHMWSIKPIGLLVDELLIGNDFHTYCKWPWPLTLWPQFQYGSSTVQGQCTW
jgi:hypothetical protein